MSHDIPLLNKSTFPRRFRRPNEREGRSNPPKRKRGSSYRGSSSSSSSQRSKQSTGFWKPGTVAPGVNIERESTTGEAKEYVVVNQLEHLSLRDQRKALPIYKHRRQIIYAVEKYPVVIIVGQTGSGKTTQIPQYLDEAGWTTGNRVIACTQPRRVAATTIARRVAEEMQIQLGQEVGYSIRFDDCTDPFRTRIKYLTDGMLLRETMSDPLLSRYSVVMLDEAHERSLHTDILIGLLKKIKKKRKDLRLIISSATLDAEDFRDFFDDEQDEKKDSQTLPSPPQPETTTSKTGSRSSKNVLIMSVEGRQHAVDVLYLEEPCRDYVDSAVATVLDIHAREKSGDILVFLTGEEEITMAVQAINDKAGRGLKAFPLYSALSSEQQEQSLSPARGYRKVVVSTNIAEASLTIPGIVYVVDSLHVKLRAYDPTASIESLLVAPVSKASAIQRSGRAGRVRPGKCYRMSTEADFTTELSPRTVPEMQRSNLTSVILQLKALGIDDILHFEFMSPPASESMIRALELLFALGALDKHCKLTDPIGTTLSEIPIEPRFARMLIASGEMKCSEEILSIAAMLSVQQVFRSPRGAHQKALKIKQKFSVKEGDHITMLNVYNSFMSNAKSKEWCHQRYLNYRALKRANELRKHLRKYMKRFKIPIESCSGDVDTIRRCVVCGFFSNAAQMQADGSYITVRGNEQLVIHPNSVLFTQAAEWVVFHDVVLTKKKYMRDITVIEPLWLSELAPQFYEYHDPLKEDLSDGKASKLRR